jgi:hypothetical protein
MAENETKAKSTEAGEKIVNITEVPSGVRAVIEKSAAGGEIKEIEMNNKDGKIFYTADIVKDGKTQEISVAADGTLMKEEEEGEKEGKEEEGKKEEKDVEQKIDFKDVPQAVKDTVGKNLGAGGPFKASLEMEDEKKVYEIETEKDGMTSSINVTEDGTLLEIEKQIPASELPKGVLSELEEECPNAKIQKITVVQKFSFEVEISVNKVKEVKISPTGKIEKDKGEEGKKEEGKEECCKKGEGKEEGKKEWGKKGEGKEEWGKKKVKEESEEKETEGEKKEAPETSKEK